jgi:hypothetical protein
MAPSAPAADAGGVKAIATIFSALLAPPAPKK